MSSGRGLSRDAGFWLVGSILVLMLFYLWTIWRRIGKVEKDMQALERRQATATR